jgi:hypothetical protein
MWWTLALAAIYVVFGLVIPFGTATTTAARIGWNAFGVLWGRAIVLTWLVSQQHRQHRRTLLEWTSDLRRLSANEFEWLVGEVLRPAGLTGPTATST